MRQTGFTEGLIAGMARKKAEQELIGFRELLDRADIRAVEEDSANQTVGEDELLEASLPD